MNKFVVDRRGNILMLVRPVKKLLHSKLISEVLNEGGLFAVNMNTGSLTIYRPPKDATIVYEREDGSKINLPMQTEEALVQLEEEFRAGNTHGKVIMKGLSFYHGGESFKEFSDYFRTYSAANVL